MSNIETRTDIRMQDIFISWTGKDRELKNRIVTYLRKNGITVLESDHNCVGNFRQWSREAVSKCTLFLLLHTENTVHSEYVPIEIEEFKKQDDWHNRCLPVVSDYSLYSEKHPDLAESESAVMLNNLEPNEEILIEILHKVQMLINNRLFTIYREVTKPTYLKLKSFLRMVNVQDREFNYETLYIQRTVIDKDENVIDDSSVFTRSEDIFFLQGPAGIGKSCYIDQLRKSADGNVLVMALSCRKLTDTRDFFKAMFEEFCRHCGNRHFYTEEDFKSLLSVKHLLLILDGMDEIATKDGTRQFLDAVSDYYQAHSPYTTLFFTSRNREDADLIAMNGQSPKRLTLSPLREEQIESFGKNLFLLLENPDKSDAFYACAKDLTKEIRTNPLLLSQLAIIYDKKDNIPQTTVGIYDAVCEITLSHEDAVTNIPDKYRDMVTLELSTILKAFSAERYRLISVSKQPAVEKILATVLKTAYPDAKDRAVFLAEYLHDRAIIIDDEFYHKMLLEYFTAVYYYEYCFNDYDELENKEALKDLFSHYGDPYWSAVLQLFLVKADISIDSEVTTNLYRTLMTYGITEYTLLFDICRNLICHKEEAQCVLVGDILRKSADGTYPPYGPLFWYVPEYDLYEIALLAVEQMKENDLFSKMLALSRDVCWIFGQKNVVTEVSNRIDGSALYETAKQNLSGIRNALCELFYIGETSFSEGTDIYPRCFNVGEVSNLKSTGIGSWERMSTPFKDELGLYEHCSYNELNGELIGFVSCPYHKPNIERTFNENNIYKVRGLALTPTINVIFTYLSIYRKNISIIYFPENCIAKSRDSLLQMNLIYENYFSETHMSYIRRQSKIVIPGHLINIVPFAFAGYAWMEEIVFLDGIESIGEKAFQGCNRLSKIIFPKTLKEIKTRLSLYFSLKSIVVSKSTYPLIKECFKKKTKNIRDVIELDAELLEIIVSNIKEGKNIHSVPLKSDSVSYKGLKDVKAKISFLSDWTFEGDRDIQNVKLPSRMREIFPRTFKDCVSLTNIMMPNDLEIIGSSAFEGCKALYRIFLPETLKTISDMAFMNCISLKKVFLPNNLLNIGYKAFTNCTMLHEIRLPPSLVFIAPNAFDGCSSLRSIRVPIGFALPLEVNKTVQVKYYHPHFAKNQNDKSMIDAHNEYENKTVNVASNITNEILINAEKPLSKNQFSGNEKITSVVIEEGITDIPKYCFSGCVNLHTVKLPSTITRISSGAFINCYNLANIELPFGLRSINESAFANCKKLRHIHFSKNILQIGGQAFCGCTSLESVELPSTLRRVGARSFLACHSLKKISISANFREDLEKIFGDIDLSLVGFIY